MKENTQIDCLIGFSFGFRKEGNSISPGESNKSLASIAAGFPNLPLILQFEIADALKAMKTGYHLYRIEKHHTAGEYLDTREVAVQAKEIMDENNWHRTFVIAHPAHIERCVLVLEKLGVSAVPLKESESVPFDPQSEQEWTRDEDQWRPREAEAVEYYQSKGWM